MSSAERLNDYLNKVRVNFTVCHLCHSERRINIKDLHTVSDVRVHYREKEWEGDDAPGC